MVVLSTLPPPTEGIRHKQTNTQAHIQGKNSKCLGTGDLFVAERFVVDLIVYLIEFNSTTGMNQLQDMSRYRTIA